MKDYISGPGGPIMSQLGIEQTACFLVLRCCSGDSYTHDQWILTGPHHTNTSYPIICTPTFFFCVAIMLRRRVLIRINALVQNAYFKIFIRDDNLAETMDFVIFVYFCPVSQAGVTRYQIRLCSALVPIISLLMTPTLPKSCFMTAKDML